MKKSVTILVVLLLVITSIWAVDTVCAEVQSNVSPVTGYVGSEARAFAVTTFGDVKTPEDLLNRLSDFAMENFTYNYPFVDSHRHAIQIFNYAKFMKGTSFVSDGIPFCGICFDFALFASVTVKTVAEYRNWEDVDVHTAHLEWKNDDGKTVYHTANFFRIGDARYFLDLSGDISLRDKG